MSFNADHAILRVADFNCSADVGEGIFVKSSGEGTVAANVSPLVSSLGVVRKATLSGFKPEIIMGKGSIFRTSVANATPPTVGEDCMVDGAGKLIAYDGTEADEKEIVATCLEVSGGVGTYKLQV